MAGEPIRTVAQLARAVESDPTLQEALKQDPVAALKALAGVPPRMLGWIYITIVSSLGLVVLATVIGGIVLAALGQEVPNGLIALGSTSLGGLVGLLSRPSEGGAPTA